MRTLKNLLAVVLVAVPAMLAALPADALTAGQYLRQGHGRYTNSSGTRMRPMLRHHRHHHVRAHRRRG